MKHLLVNGFSAVSGGGATILNSYLEGLANGNVFNGYTFHVVTPGDQSYNTYANQNIKIYDRRTLPSAENSFLFSELGISRFCRTNRIDAILNFGDLIPKTSVPQAYFFDWAYLLYPESTVWKSMSVREWISRSLKFSLIKKRVKKPKVTFVQCDAMASRMKILTESEVVTIKSPCRLPSSPKRVPVIELPIKPISKLLVLSGYASHKNFSLLIDLAKLIKSRAGNFSITLTIDAKANSQAMKLMEKIKAERLDDIITNLGTVSHDQIPVLLERYDALLLPTLLESYGLPYIEGMAFNKTIITSGLDFARSVCGDSAYYFNPHSPQDALDVIQKASMDWEQRMYKIEVGRRLVVDLPSVSQFACILNKRLFSIA